MVVKISRALVAHHQGSERVNVEFYDVNGLIVLDTLTGCFPLVPGNENRTVYQDIAWKRFCSFYDGICTRSCIYMGLMKLQNYWIIVILSLWILYRVVGIVRHKFLI